MKKKTDNACYTCKKVIRKGNFSIAEIFNDKNQNISHRQNAPAKVFHPSCFSDVRAQFNWTQSAEALFGFDKLPLQKQKRLNDLFQ